MKNVSTGAGLCVLGLCIVGYPLVDRISTRAEAGVPAAGAVAAAALAQDPPAPTIVWYGTDTVLQSVTSQVWCCSTIWRAWSDGKVEAMVTRRQTTGYNVNYFDTWCSDSGFCTSGWKIVSSPAQGLTFNADLNFDEAVDGADLGELLAKWGPAPRNPVPPSDCPLALINPLSLIHI